MVIILRYSSILAAVNNFMFLFVCVANNLIARSAFVRTFQVVSEYFVVDPRSHDPRSLSEGNMSSFFGWAQCACSRTSMLNRKGYTAGNRSHSNNTSRLPHLEKTAGRARRRQDAFWWTALLERVRSPIPMTRA